MLRMRTSSPTLNTPPNHVVRRTIRMSRPTFFVEILPRIEVAQVTIAGRYTTEFSFTKNAIAYHGSSKDEERCRSKSEEKQVCRWINQDLKLKTCREMKLIPKEGLSLRFEITSEGSSQGGQYHSCPNFVVPKDELAEYGAEQCQLSLRCAFCHSELSLKECIFKRVLPLPSEGWEEVSGNYFCHNHTHGGREGEGEDFTGISSGAKLIPKEGDCLISSDQLILRAAALDKNRFTIKNDSQTTEFLHGKACWYTPAKLVLRVWQSTKTIGKAYLLLHEVPDQGGNSVLQLHCQRCLLRLGHAISDHQCADASISPVEVAVFQLRRSKLQIVRSTENVPTVDVCRSRRDVGIHLARRLLSFSQSRAAFQFKIVDHVGKVYLTVWMLHVLSRMMFASVLRKSGLFDRFSGTSCSDFHDNAQYEDCLVLKLLFQCDLLSSAPQLTGSTDTLELTTHECLLLVLLLMESNRTIAPSRREANQFKVGFLELSTFTQ